MQGHSKSEPPEPVPLDEWRDQISIALRSKCDENLVAGSSPACGTNLFNDLRQMTKV